MTQDQMVMWSIGQIAERDSVSKAAVSKAVKKLSEDHPDTPIDRGPQGQVLLVSVAHYDHYRQRHVNPAKATAPLRRESTTGTTPLTDSESFDEARRINEWLKVGRERIRMQEDAGQLLRKDRVEDAQRQAGREIQNIIRRIQNRADDIALAVSKEGVHGARIALRAIAFELGNEVADRLAVVASDASDEDEFIEGA